MLCGSCVVIDFEVLGLGLMVIIMICICYYDDVWVCWFCVCVEFLL